MKIFLTFIFIIGSTLNVVAAKEGNGSSGGGNGVIFPDGHVELVDLIQPNHLPDTPADEEFIKNTFFSKNRFVHQFGQKDDQFFKCAKDILIKSKIPSLVRLQTHLNSTNVYQIEVRLGQTMNPDIKDSIVSYYANTSRKIPAEYQEPLAAFNQMQLWIAKRFYNRMDDKNKCALAVHEALRVLNFHEILSEKLSTDDIEEITQALMISGTSSNAKLFSLKLKWNEAWEKATQLRNQLLNVLITPAGKALPLNLQKDLHKIAWDFYDKVREYDASYGSEATLKVSQRMCDLSHESEARRDLELKKQLSNACHSMLDITDELIVRGAISLGTELSLNMPRQIQYGFMNVLSLDYSITHKSKWYQKRFDTWIPRQD